MTNHERTSNNNVYLDYIPDYDSLTNDLIFKSLDSIITQIPKNSKVLIKPNLISQKNCAISCTDPRVIRSVTHYFNQFQNQVTIGDSPAFGTAKAIYQKLDMQLRELPARIVNFNKKTRVNLDNGLKIPFSTHVLESDYVVNIAKLKVHNQVGMSAAVKNIFGCVPGTRKALHHALYGEKSNLFEQTIVSLMQHLPGSIHILDGIQAMHISGPTGGEPYNLGMLGMSENPVALDTAAYSAFNLSPEHVPIWKECQRQNLSGSRKKEPLFPFYSPGQFPTGQFTIPQQLSLVSFHPARIAKSTAKRFFLFLRDTALAR